MAEALLSHQAPGQRSGFLELADTLRNPRDVVYPPDLYDGKMFEDLKEGVGYAEQVGFAEILNRGTAVAPDFPTRILYTGTHGAHTGLLGSDN